MSMLSVFEFESQEIRFVDDHPVATDVATTLGYADPFDAVKRHVFEINKVTGDSPVTRGGKITLLKEAGIYQLIFSSKLPSAIKFQQWVFDEVLPSIRKTGSYSVYSDYENMSIDELKESLERKKLLIAHLKSDKQLERLKPIVTEDVTDIRIAKILRLVKRKGEITASIIKQYLKTDFGNASSTEINELLIALVEQGKVERVDTYKNKGIKIRVKV